MNKEIEQGFQEMGKPDLNSTEVSSLQIKRLRTIVNERINEQYQLI